LRESSFPSAAIFIAGCGFYQKNPAKKILWYWHWVTGAVRPACAFNSGNPRDNLFPHYRLPQQVTKTACYAMGDDRCRLLLVI
jgi:hypothetical protein